MNIKEFLRSQEWVVYKINGSERKFFGDTYFGPMWKEFPKDMEIPSDLNLGTMDSVIEYLKINPNQTDMETNDVVD